MTGHGVHRAVSCRYGFGLAVDGEGVAVNIDEGLAVGIVRGVDILALGSLDHVGALVAAAMQAVVKGCTGNGIECALVGLAARVKIAGRRRRPCRLNSLCRPILCPGQSRISVGVLAFSRLCVLLVVSCLQRVIDRGLDGVRGNRRRGDGVDVAGVAGFLDLADNALVRRSLFAIAVNGLAHAIPVVVAKRAVVGNLDFRDLGISNGYRHRDVVALVIPLVALVQGVFGIGYGLALVFAVCDFGQIIGCFLRGNGIFAPRQGIILD